MVYTITNTQQKLHFFFNSKMFIPFLKLLLLKIVHGKPRHSQSQGSVERANQDVENMLATWLTDNKTNK
ncbi:Uncharacterized protein FWK35_00017713 [Aphis craccivora]|uniref:Integrase catalytic domain-containing protein n=1 Tax=Aphis craccivora TaxID=307492 RepID=A0A6G0Y9J3_APHCR|nr:Uncharacterized protein FWK35_00017713 [Aphis craccivora]